MDATEQHIYLDDFSSDLLWSHSLLTATSPQISAVGLR
jgi:hypothetical protein